MRMNRRRINRSSSRSGVAVVELAILMPVLLLVVFGTIGTCNTAFVRQAAITAAYEGGRVAVWRWSDADDVRERIGQFLDERGVSGYSVEIVPENFSTIKNAEPVEIRVSVSMSANQNFVLIPGARQVNATTTVYKERFRWH